MYKIAIVGCEGVGKTTTSKILADLYKTFYSQEFGKFYCQEKIGSFRLDGGQLNVSEKDFERIFRGQIKWFEQTTKKASVLGKKLCFFDTDLIFTSYFLSSVFPESELFSRFDRENNFDIWIYLENYPFIFRKDAILNKENYKKESVKLWERYKRLVPTKRLFFVDESDLKKKLQKIIDIFSETFPDVDHPEAST